MKLEHSKTQLNRRLQSTTYSILQWALQRKFPWRRALRPSCGNNPRPKYVVGFEQHPREGPAKEKQHCQQPFAPNRHFEMVTRQKSSMTYSSMTHVWHVSETRRKSGTEIFRHFLLDYSSWYSPPMPSPNR